MEMSANTEKAQHLLDQIFDERRIDAEMSLENYQILTEVYDLIAADNLDVGGWENMTIQFTDQDWHTCDYAGCDREVYPNFDSMFCVIHYEDD
jgi:hypothetical protein